PHSPECGQRRPAFWRTRLLVQESLYFALPLAQGGSGVGKLRVELEREWTIVTNLAQRAQELSQLISRQMAREQRLVQVVDPIIVLQVDVAEPRSRPPRHGRRVL